MEKITIIQDSSGKDVVVIDHGNEQFTSMLKSTYDEQQAALSTPIVTPPVVEETPVVEESAPEEEAPPVEEETI